MWRSELGAWNTVEDAVYISLWDVRLYGFDLVNNLILLGVFWLCWCVMHSALIDRSVTGAVERRLPNFYRYYRLLYNGVSLITLIPLLIITWMMGGDTVFSWTGWSILVRISLLLCSFVLFYAGSQRYDVRYFLGITQIQSGMGSTLLGASEDFTDTGAFGIVRHPWYLGSLLFIWSIRSHYSLSFFVVTCILSVYLVVGTFLEERKIIAEYGESYREYQRRVSMLFPWKWLLQKIR